MEPSVTLSAIGVRPADIADRFWAKVDRTAPDLCWLWIAGADPRGYGLFKVGSRTTATTTAARAHRVAYELANGSLPAGKSVLHSCDVRRCCNPAHLFLGTKADNNRDRDQKGRTAKGESTSDAKLTDELVREARHLARTTTVMALARRFGVSHVTMWKAVNRRTWRHVQ